MNLEMYAVLVIAAIASFFIGYFVGYSPRPVGFKSWTSRNSDKPFKRPCKHGGGYCKDIELFNECPAADPTQKVTCWAAGVFEDDPCDGEMSVDIGGP